LIEDCGINVVSARRILPPNKITREEINTYSSARESLMVLKKK